MLSQCYRLQPYPRLPCGLVRTLYGVARMLYGRVRMLYGLARMLCGLVRMLYGEARMLYGLVRMLNVLIPTFAHLDRQPDSLASRCVRFPATVRTAPERHLQSRCWHVLTPPQPSPGHRSRSAQCGTCRGNC